MREQISKERIPFKPEYDDKRDLVRWVRGQFPHLDAYRFGKLKEYPEFEERIPEVHEAAMQVLNRLMTSYPSPQDSMHRYYKGDYVELPRTLQKNNKREYANRLDAFIEAIEQE